MFKVVKNGDHSDPYKVNIIADLSSDVAELPKDNVAVGSSCLVLEGSKVYIFGNDGEWHKI